MGEWTGGDNDDQEIVRMKLKKRLLVSGIALSFLCVCVYVLDTLPKVIDGNKFPFIVASRERRSKLYMESNAHISALRKRLNKSNYTSDDSPEGGGRGAKIQTPGGGGTFRGQRGG